MFLFAKTPFRRPRRYEFMDWLNVKIDIRIKSYDPGKFKRQCFSSVQAVFSVLPESDPKPYIYIALRAKGNHSPKHSL